MKLPLILLLARNASVPAETGTYNVTAGGLEDLLVSDCSFDQTDRAIRIKTVRAATAASSSTASTKTSR